MKAPFVVVCALSFAAGAGGYFFVRPAAGLRGLPGPEAAAASARPAAKNGPDSGEPLPAIPEITEASPEAILAFLGLQAPPTLEDVLTATGLDRSLRMALFLQNATSDDLKQAITRCREARIYDLSVTDAIWLKWVEIDREAAFAHDPQGSATWWAWANIDPEAALAAAQGKPAALESVIRALGQDDPARARDLLALYPDADKAHVWDGILNGMGKTDAAAAARMAWERGEQLKEYVSDWAVREPGQALDWAKSLPSASERLRAMDFVLQGLVAADPAAALRELEDAPPGRSRLHRTGEAIVALASSDPEAALQRAQALPHPAERQHALMALAESLASRDPATALSIMSGVDWKMASLSRQWSYSENGKITSSGHFDPDWDSSDRHHHCPGPFRASGSIGGLEHGTGNSHIPCISYHGRMGRQPARGSLRMAGPAACRRIQGPGHPRTGQHPFLFLSLPGLRRRPAMGRHRLSGTTGWNHTKLSQPVA